MKKLLSLLLTIAVLICGNSTYAVYAQGPEVLDLNTMLDLLLKDGSDFENIQISADLLELQNKEKIEDYKDLKEKTVNSYQANLNLSWASVEAELEKYGKLGADAAYNYARTKIDLYNNAKIAYRQVLEQYVGQMKSLEPVILQINQAKRQKQVEVEKLKLSFTKDYYNLYMAENDLELAKKDLASITNQITAEKVKLYNGLSTQLAVDELEKQKNDIEVSIMDGKNGIELMKERIKAKLNIDIENDLKIEYYIPENLTVSNYVLKDLTKSFKEKNLDVEKLMKNEEVCSETVRAYEIAYIPNSEIEAWSPSMTEEQADKIQAAKLQLKKAQNDTKSKRKEMDQYVIKTYFDYKKAAANYENSKISEGLSIQQQAVINVKLAQGQISQLQYNTETLKNEKSLFAAKKARINFYLAKMQLELAMEGIMMQ